MLRSPNFAAFQVPYISATSDLRLNSLINTAIFVGQMISVKPI